MSINADRHNKRIEQAKLSKISYMSNSKWIKLFNAIEENSVIARCATVKLLNNDQAFPFSIYQNIDKAVNYTTDNACGPIALKDIEWICIPAACETERYNRAEKLASTYTRNDLQKLKQLMDSLGLFEYDCDENGLRIYGYK